MIKQTRYLIYLAGFMGSGKSTIAPILANTLGFDYVDIDKEIENISGKKVTEIFSDLGEEYFREVELSLLTELCKRTECVISLGGGTITNETILQIIQSSGTLIYLKANIEQIFHRLKNKTDRPLIKAGNDTILDDQQLRARLHTLLIKREPFYNQADIIVHTDEHRVGVTVDEIVRRLKHANII